MSDPDYGFTLRAVNGDLDPGLIVVTGAAAVAQDLAHRVSTPEGGLWYDPDYESVDLRDYLSAGISPAEAYRLRAKVERAIRQDERVDDAEIDVDFNPVARALTVAVEGESAAGPFGLVVAASAAQTAILEAAAR